MLADRNGVIDIDLPISGSLNDPQFRLGPIFRVIVNLDRQGGDGAVQPRWPVPRAAVAKS